MPNMDPKKCPMPSQEPNVRNKNFKEVALGYTEEMAVNEAKRCLQCKNHPCRSGCPVEIDIPGFIKHVAEGDFEAAYNVIAQSSALPAVCGRVCPQEHQCEGKCVRGIKGEAVGIGRLERFVADWYRNNVHTKPTAPAPNGHKVAVIGAGPSGVTVYEALHVAGGVLMYGIPEFRLPKDIVQHEVEGLKELGVDIETNMVIGKVLTIDELMNDYGFEAVYVASGAGLPRFMGIPGESLKGVYSANEYLTRVNLMKAYKEDSRTPIMKSKSVAVVGGGNVAMDAARCAKRLGAENVYIVYRRGMAELPARKEEVEHAEEEGIIFKTLTNPTEVLEKSLAVNGGKEYDLSILIVNVPACEMAAILPVRDNGTVYFFSMATDFAKAALGAEGCGKDVTMIVGNGYTKDHAEITLSELRENAQLKEYFEKKYL